MKAFFFALVSFLSLTASSQYYFKDIIGAKESSALVSSYLTNKVQTVTLKSYTINNTPLENLSVQQEFSPVTRTLRTVTKSEYLPASYLTSYFDELGKVVKTTDSTAGIVNTTVYSYNDAGLLISIRTSFGDNLATLKSDEHIWQYDLQNRVDRMLRIRNGKDSSVVLFKLDNAGNVIEEQETVRFIKQEPFYYYYDNKNNLSDIVRFNKKAARLMPEQMFEYAENNQLIQRTTIPQNSSEYLIWRYRFDTKGLKAREEIFNKQKELTGKVVYSYTFSNQ